MPRHRPTAVVTGSVRWRRRNAGRTTDLRQWASPGAGSASSEAVSPPGREQLSTWPGTGTRVVGIARSARWRHDQRPSVASCRTLSLSWSELAVGATVHRRGSRHSRRSPSSSWSPSPQPRRHGSDVGPGTTRRSTGRPSMTPAPNRPWRTRTGHPTCRARVPSLRPLERRDPPPGTISAPTREAPRSRQRPLGALDVPRRRGRAARRHEARSPQAAMTQGAAMIPASIRRVAGVVMGRQRVERLRRSEATIPSRLAR